MVLPHEFFLAFGGNLDLENRWIVMANLIPWRKIEEAYVDSLKDWSQGKKALSARIAIGSLVIKEFLNLSDRETVLQIKENPYLQYFLGLSSFQEEDLFHPSLMTHFRKRLGPEVINQVNEWMVEEQTKQASKNQKADSEDKGDSVNQSSCSQDSEIPKDSLSHQGNLLIDATCTPADITYPTDLRLLNEAREKLEGIIDTLHEPYKGKQAKPRTYRKQARKAYLSVAKQRRPKQKIVRKAIGKQLNFIKRDINHMKSLIHQVGLKHLSKKQYRDLLIIQELYRQQQQMYETKNQRIEDRIVSIQQPHIRPIVRGKSKANVEFGAKISVSVIDGFAFLDEIGWDSYHEGSLLEKSVESYRERHGVYPEAVLADQIYSTRENRRYCKEHGIRLSGPKLGRPSKKTKESDEQKRIGYQDAVARNAIEGKFGEGKRTYGLGLIRARLQKTSETVISLQFLVMNLSKALRESFLSFLTSWSCGPLRLIIFK